MSEEPGFVVAIEGPDGVGKTTLLEMLEDRFKKDPTLADLQWTVVPIRFPTYKMPVPSDISTLIQQMLNGAIPFDPVLMQAWQTADKRLAQPQIKDARLHNIVIIDRYIGSSLAYGEADGQDPAWLTKIHEGMIQPDVTILLVGKCYRQYDGGDGSVYDINDEFQVNLEAVYRRLSGELPGWYVVDNHQRTPSQVLDVVMGLLRDYIKSFTVHP